MLITTDGVKVLHISTSTENSLSGTIFVSYHSHFGHTD